MVDVASIIVAVLSFVGALAAAAFTAYATFFTDERRRQTEAQKLVAKYHDPLLLACQDFQSRLHNILEWNIAEFLPKAGRKRDNLLIYTAFVVGQYLSWTYILRRQAQFLKLDTDKGTMRLTKALAGIVWMFSTDSFHSEDAEPFNMWRGDQMAIGEVMTIKDGDEMFPMGYAAFYEKWMENGSIVDLTDFENAKKGANKEFRMRFQSIIEGVIKIGEAKNAKHAKPNDKSVVVPDQRLRCLQHRLIDLIATLDPHNLRTESSKDYTTRCPRAATCHCMDCLEREVCPCDGCGDRRKKAAQRIGV